MQTVYPWSQYQAPWGGLPYDTYFITPGGPGAMYTIGDKGCALTAYAMIFRSMGLTLDIGNGPEAVTPQVLNTWLNQNNGYYTTEPQTGLIKPNTIAYICPTITVQITSDPTNLDAALSNCKPTLIRVKPSGGPRHYVLVTKKIGNTYELIDPINGKIRTLANYNNQFFEIVSF